MKAISNLLMLNCQTFVPFRRFIRVYSLSNDTLTRHISPKHAKLSILLLVGILSYANIIYHGTTSMQPNVNILLVPVRTNIYVI
jgi:hypothetical protein